MEDKDKSPGVGGKKKLAIDQKDILKQKTIKKR